MDGRCVEKEALAGLFEHVLYDLNVDLAVCRGYPSATFLKDAAGILEDVEDKEIVILYYGDHDPSGEDIERYVSETLRYDWAIDCPVKRIATTPEQIDHYNIPPIPAKRSDARYRRFVARHGDVSVELDALDPKVLEELIKTQVEEYFDELIYKDTLDAQRKARVLMREKIEELLEGGDDEDEDGES